MNTQRNTTLELLKLFASYMVVCIHILFDGRIGSLVDALARFAVPLFFLTSGFYSYQIKPEKIIKRIRNILTLLILAIVCYTSFNIATLLLEGNIDGVSHYFSRYFNSTALIKLFIFNVPVGTAPASTPHLWYLLAIIYVYVVFYFATVLHFNEKIGFIISILLLFLHIVLGECLSAFGILLHIHYMRNFALMGIPFFTLGLSAKKYEDKLRTTPKYVPVIAVAIGILGTVFSRYFNGKNELYVGSIFVLLGLVIVFIKYPNVKCSRIINALEGCSTYIYIFHIMISTLIKKIYALFDINFSSSAILRNVHPVLVCVVSTAFAYCIVQLINVVRQRIKRENNHKFSHNITAE